MGGGSVRGGAPPLRRLVDRYSPGVALLLLVAKLLQVVRIAGVSPREDGWRRATRAFFRAERAKFCLTAFRLETFSDGATASQAVGPARNSQEAAERLVRRLALFLGGQRIMRRRLNWGRAWPTIEEWPYVDLVVGTFDSDGTLREVVPHLEGSLGTLIDEAAARSIQAALVREYGATRHLRDTARPRNLKSRLTKWIRRNLPRPTVAPALEYAERLLSATFIHIAPGELAGLQPGESPGRFAAPDFAVYRHPGQGLLNVEIRFDSAGREADLWVQANHILVDGAPVQELLSALSAEWGVAGSPLYPAVPSGGILTIQYSEVDQQGNYHALALVDLAPVLRARQELRRRLGASGGELTLLSLLAWGLAHHAAFAHTKFLFPIDLAAAGGRERSLGLVFLRPACYVDQTDPLQGFLKYQREFSRRLQETRARRSESYELVESFALLPPMVHSLTRRIMPKALGEMIGTVGLSVVREASVFVGALSDVHDSFLAFGNMTVPTADGGAAGSFSVKGSRPYVEASLEAVTGIGRHLSNLLADGAESLE